MLVDMLEGLLSFGLSLLLEERVYEAGSVLVALGTLLELPGIIVDKG